MQSLRYDAHPSTTVEDVASSLTGLRTAADRVERPADLGEPEISVTPPGRITPELVAAYAEAGVHRLVVLAPPNTGWVGPLPPISDQAA